MRWAGRRPLWLLLAVPLLAGTQVGGQLSKSSDAVCVDTCTCSERADGTGCGANNGFCEEAIALRAGAGVSKDRVCAMGHCCPTGSDGTDCAALRPCSLASAGPVAPRAADDRTETCGLWDSSCTYPTKTVSKVVYTVWVFLGYMYLKSRLPILEGPVTAWQQREARKKGMSLPAFRQKRRFRVTLYHLFTALVLLTLLPMVYKFLVPLADSIVIGMFFNWNKEIKELLHKQFGWFAATRGDMTVPGTNMDDATLPSGASPAPPANGASSAGGADAEAPVMALAASGTLRQSLMDSVGPEPVLVQSDLQVERPIHSVQVVKAVESPEVLAYAFADAQPEPEPAAEVVIAPDSGVSTSSNPTVAGFVTDDDV